MKRWIGIDAGEKRTGIAMTDPLGIVAPRKTVKTEELIEEIQQIKEKYKIKGIVMGLPLTPRGKIGQRAKMIKDLKKKIEKELNLEVKLQDERYTTKEAMNIAKKMGKVRDKKLLDRISASLILRSYLEEN